MFESDYGAETADYDPREDAEERDAEEPAGSYWDQVLAGRLVQPATLLASFPHF